jgi:hypothetical protein
VLTAKEYLGKMAIRTDVQVKSLSDPKYFADIYSAFEDIGIVCRFVKGICRIDI